MNKLSLTIFLVVGGRKTLLLRCELPLIFLFFVDMLVMGFKLIICVEDFPLGVYKGFSNCLDVDFFKRWVSSLY